jgi:L-rhamnose mutarotase
LDYVGNIWRARPGRAEEYVRRHQTIWPEVADLLRASGVRSYAIYMHGDFIISHIETTNYADLVSRLADSEIANRWDARFDDVVEYPNADPATGWPERLRHVWHL